MISQDALPIKLRCIGIGEAQGVLKRHFAPITVGRLIRELKQAPLAGPVMRYGTGQLCVQTSVVAGKEKAVDQVEPGELVYTPQNSNFCICVEHLKPYSPVNRIGVITEGLELFKTLRTGSSISIQLAE